ncbi:MAG: NUDIX hydrolase [Haliea sp.]|jgi:8-oxo-dGTP pyrophosphatase MutT (NUDIX family)|uniref:NUDIX hydrolase n=1 Tax=Haliea sp. TaxID=1932666 RepID=UPI000C361F17|nr:NUDIX hydrolase [Haliea sp.]MBM71106.1 NUDIX hydrolase [Haliea sp.]|tara:strand:- start:59700 stop:60152 length:453 start_codon:yes stop_codon:yes gene_type:complete
MSDWQPHVTVATVVFDGARYLLVEERDKTTGKPVFNQPAGHLEARETLFQAALRETREETGWEVMLEGVLGLARYVAPGNGVTYYRTTFCARPLQALPDAVLDSDILAVHWLRYEEILAVSARMRSPLVLAAIEQHRSGIRYPLDLISPA